MFNGSGKAIDKGPAVMAEDFLDIQGKILRQMVQNFSFVSDYSNGSKHKGKLKWSYFENYFKPDKDWWTTFKMLYCVLDFQARFIIFHFLLSLAPLWKELNLRIGKINSNPVWKILNQRGTWITASIMACNGLRGMWV